jgi:UDP-glucose:(heptosyl)LPS alpha-1,3-glucosyltransferase
VKITLGIRYFEPRGGAEKFSLRLARFLAARGHRVRVHAFHGAPEEGIELCRLPWPRHAGRAWRDWESGRRLAAVLRADDADVTWGEQKVWDAHVVRPGGGSEEIYWRAHARFSLGGAGAPEWLRYFALKRWFDVDAEHRAYRGPRLRRVVVNSALVRDHLLRFHPMLAGRITVVHNGAEPVAGGADGGHAGLRVLFAGHDFRRKGLAPAIEAVALAHRRRPDLDLRLVVAGRDNPAPFRRLAARRGVAERVDFRGADADLRGLYRESDVLILPTHFDPFANVTIEALAAGLPVLTTRANGGSEVLTDGVDGWVLRDGGDVARAAEVLLGLESAARRAEHRAAARATAARHTLDDKLRQVEEILLAAARIG